MKPYSVLLGAIIICAAIASTWASNSLYVSSTRGSDSDGCGRNETSACKSMFQVLLAAQLSVDNIIYIEAGNYSGRNNMNLNFANVPNASTPNSTISITITPWTASATKLTPPLIVGDVQLQGGQISDADGSIFELGSQPFVELKLVRIHIGQGRSTKEELAGGVTLSNAESSFSAVGCDFQANVGIRGSVLHVSEGTATLTACNFFNNTAANGGAVYITGAKSFAVITRTTFTNNTATKSGGALVTDSKANVTVMNSTFVHNSAKWDGGAVLLDQLGTISFENSTVSWNSATEDGGAFASMRGYIKLTNTLLEYNVANNGGAISLKDPGASMATYKGTALRSNAAVANGGAIYCENARFHLFDQTIVDANVAGNSGGGLHLVATAFGTTNETHITNNMAFEGAGISLLYSSQARLFYTTIENNRAQSSGGGLWCSSSSVNITHSDFVQNVIIVNDKNNTESEFFCTKNDACDVRQFTNSTTDVYTAQCSLPQPKKPTILERLTSWERALILSIAAAVALFIVIVSTGCYIIIRRRRKSAAFYNAMREIEMETNVRSHTEHGDNEDYGDYDWLESAKRATSSFGLVSRQESASVSHNTSRKEDLEEAGGAIWLSQQLSANDDDDDVVEDDPVALLPSSLSAPSHNRKW